MKQRHSSHCPRWAPYLAALHPADLSPEEQRGLAAHLAICPACAEARADYLAMAARIERLPSVRPLAALPAQLARAWAERERIPTKPGTVSERALAGRSLHLVPLHAGAAQAAHEGGAAVAELTLVAAPEDDGKEPEESRLQLSDRGQALLDEAYDEAYVELHHLAEHEVTGLAGLPERLPTALAVLPPVFSFARPARATSPWQALVACFVLVPLLLVIMPLGALQRLGDTASGSTLDAYVQPLSFTQQCTGLLGLPTVPILLDNSKNSQPLEWRISIQDTDPSGSLPWAKASVTGGTVPAGERSTFALTPLGVLCEIMSGAPAPIEYHVIFFSQGQRTTITDRVTPP